MSTSAISAVDRAHVHTTPWGEFLTLKIFYDPEYKILSYGIKETPRPCFTLQVLEEIRGLQLAVKEMTQRELDSLGISSVNYLVAASDAPDGAHFGGDLEFFLRVIRAGDRRALSEYAHLAIDVLYENFANLGTEINTVAIIRGPTLGAAFEAALSCDFIIADKGAQLGFPETLFNMFPGMGAYSFLARRISPAQAERMIKSGRMYSANELYDFGLIDILSDEGRTDLAFSRYIRSADRRLNTRHALRKIRSIVNPITYDELRDIVDLWIDTAFRLADYNLEMMERLLAAQNKRRERLRHQR